MTQQYNPEPKCDEVISVSRKKYDRLMEDSKKLQALEAAGVDNWDGYGFAMEEIWAEEED